MPIGNQKPKPFKGTYQIIKAGDPSVIYKTQEVSSKLEFDTLLEEVVQYNKNNANSEKRMLILL